MGLTNTTDKPSRRERKAAEEYAESPVGLAIAARQRGDRFFQLEVENGEVGRYAWWTPLAGGSAMSSAPGIEAPDLIGQIEEAGWHLEHVTQVFAQVSEINKRRGSLTRGVIIGTYLFRAA